MKTRNGRRGFTLVELCFGLVIVGILAGLAIPSLRASLAAGAIRSASFELAAGVHQARSSAIVQDRPAVLCASDVAGRCVPAGQRATGWRSFIEGEDGETPLASRALPRGVVLLATRPRLTFWPQSAAASTVTLTICDSRGLARPRAIVISQSGRARQAEGDAGRCRA